MDTTLRPIGVIVSSLTDLSQCPKQGDEGAPEAWVEIAAPYVPGLDTLTPGLSLTLLTWLHRADRDVLSVHPRGDTRRPKRGVFNTRSPARPNPVGLHEVRLLELIPGGDGSMRLRVAPLEALDGTPVIDIKTSYRQRQPDAAPESASKEVGNTIRATNCTANGNTNCSASVHVISGSAPSPWGEGIPDGHADELRRICLRGWQRGLYSGFNGNASLRIGTACLLTCSGAAKGDLGLGDLALVDIATGAVLAGGKPSSEGAMHLAIYRARPDAMAVVHTHPPRLLALGALVPPDDMLRLPIYESELLRGQLGFAPAHAPGTQELADAVAAAAASRDAVWMERHGLCCAGPSAARAPALAEELEHLAGVQLAVLAAHAGVRD
ncbi:tRNA (N6-threonylcarbamoyladenosine(37)-N6)-methyltransferase TrmO [Nitratidesulfovibrio liaohensis]|uniref:tRNA (N6-threonylcarbamoyladenosine(37)-N6)-methyltransferase TrmO n=1 Tax=Nitratidesulfovibrio liaohensis TaxID=2604158 RepID=A0ABY9R070_9BACT|nr:tRNA (N6-threonylcarbamoyladenosine(37)-N6)-methyltransferase TrmO [Nitratidesulfovibrio liaohensis]WMW64213.1 tRNA (N6-threonylcarbamoyladenosine(37)-N6)-methyltransferase TrmO [Nitratidesulfovibrio liaohensis]